MQESLTTEAELSQFLLGCPLQMKIGSNVCYCTCPPWMKQSKRKIKRLRKLIGKFFTTDDCDVYLLHLIPWAHRVCTCQHGNYMIQEVMSGASMSALQVFISSCDIAEIMTNEFGSRVVETLTEIHDGAFVPLILNRMAHGFGRLARDPRANYGVQKLCGNMPLDKYEALMRVAVPHAARLSMDPHGAYVVQVILNKLCDQVDWSVFLEEDRHYVEIGAYPQEESLYTMLESMLSTLVDLGPKLIQHPRGNFTVQAMIRALHLCPRTERRFVSDICANAVTYIGCKFGTRVVESVLESDSSGDIGKEMIVGRLLEISEEDFEAFVRGESSQYLIPKVLICASTVQKKAFAARVTGVHTKKQQQQKKEVVPDCNPSLSSSSSSSETE